MRWHKCIQTEYLKIAQNNGLRCHYSNVCDVSSKESYTSLAAIDLRQDINDDDEGRRHSHYKENLHLVLFICNDAQGATPASELISLLEALQNSSVVASASSSSGQFSPNITSSDQTIHTSDADILKGLQIDDFILNQKSY